MTEELPKMLTKEEQEKYKKAVNKLVGVFYSVYFGYPLRKPDILKDELKEAKALLSEVRCAEVIA